MKKPLKIIGFAILFLIAVIAIYFFVNNESLPEGQKGKEADALATKMLEAMNFDAYKNTEIIEWNFTGNHYYKWLKQEDIVEVSWDDYKVVLHTNSPEKSIVFENNVLITDNDRIKEATDLYNNDSFWVVAPFKILDPGTERSIVNYEGKEALLVTYTSGGTTPGDSYLWILDENYMPVAFKMWTKIIPIGGVYATWNNWKTTEAGIKLPQSHKLSLFGIEVDITDLNAYNKKANDLANKILDAVKHDAYKNTRYIEWSFRGNRFFKWDKKRHEIAVSWDTIRVHLHPNELEKSTVFYNNNIQKNADQKMVNKALDFFNNDSFWLVAPHKLFDHGVIRTLKNVDNQAALHVEYTSGGSTPGDSYLWVLDEKFVPKSFKMYVPSMKMDGLEATWQDWITTESGTLLPTNHVIAEKTVLNMGEVKGYNE